MSASPIILGLDPGTRNFAYAVVDSNGLKESGYLDAVDTFDMATMPAKVQTFTKQVHSLVEKYQIKHITVERFQNRGKARAGATGEYVNVMLGILAFFSKFFDIEIRFVVPGLWKKYMLRQYGTHEMDKLVNNLTIHECDAIGMAVFTLEMYYGSPRGSQISSVNKTLEGIPNGKSKRSGRKTKKSKSRLP